MKRFIHILAPVVGVSIFLAVLTVLYEQLAKYRTADIIAEFRSLPASWVTLSLLLTASNYLVLTAYDTLSFKFLHHHLPYRKVAFASFLSYVFSHNVGLSFLGGSAVRFRFYSAWGVNTAEVAELVVLNSVTFWLGFLALAGIGLLLRPDLVLDDLGISVSTANGIGLACLALLTTYLVWTAIRHRSLRWRSWEVPLPPLRLSLEQLLLSSIDWALAAGVLYVLLPSGGHIGFVGFLSAFLLAQVAGLVSHVPAGLGVFDTAIVLFLTPEIPPPAVLGALLAYRIIYYVLPLFIAAAMLSFYELMEYRGIVLRAGRTVASRAPDLLASLLTLLVFLSGALLVVSGAIEPQHSRLEWLDDLLPLSFFEVSHLLGSLVGMLLLLLSRGLQQRLDAARRATMALLVTGAVAMILKGFHLEEALFSSLTALLLWPCRRVFYRRSALLQERFTLGWVAGIVATCAGITWLGLFSYNHVEYTNELWWQLELSAHVSRSLRSMLAVSIVLAGYGVARLLRPAHPAAVSPDQVDWTAVKAVVANSPESSAHLALLGDKRFFFNTAHTAMAMYGVAGRHWIAMGDPLGTDADIRELAWQFCEAADRMAAAVSFYEVGVQHLPLYLDLGMSLIKLGEQARVDLGQFSLEGGAHKSLRQHTTRTERDGCRFSIVPVSEVPPLFDELEAVSVSWLAHKNTREKRFSLGAFDRSYLSQTPLAVVRHGGRIIAFSNYWLGAAKEELAPDLMRYHENAPPGVMDYLFVRLMQWAQEEGYRWFNLGMAPLSGLDVGALTPLHGRVADFLFRHGEHFYNFQGLREYKEKFDPVWSPRYLATPSPLRLPSVLAALASLVSGGLAGVVKK